MKAIPFFVGAPGQIAVFLVICSGERGGVKVWSAGGFGCPFPALSMSCTLKTCYITTTALLKIMSNPKLILHPQTEML